MPQKKTAVQLAMQQLKAAQRNISAAHSIERDTYDAAQLAVLERSIARAHYDAEEIDTRQRQRFGKGAK